MTDFDRQIKDLEEELLALKTASQYSSVRSARTTSTTNVYTGTYKITYQDTPEPVFSSVYGTFVSDNGGTVWPRTPSGNTQVVEVNSDSSSGATSTIQMTIISNKAVTNVTRL